MDATTDGIGRIASEGAPARDAGTGDDPAGVWDWALAVGVGLAGAAVTAGICAQWGDELARLSLGGRWFQSDGWRVFDDLTQADANHYRSTVHPLFTLLGLPLVTLVRGLGDLSPIAAIWAVQAAISGLWATALFAACRWAGCDRVSAALLAGLGSVSAGALCWFTVPETYPLGSASIALCVALSAFACRRRVADGVLVAAHALSHAFTVTNAMAGAALLATRHAPRRAAALVLLGSALVALSIVGQRLVFPQPGQVLRPEVVQGEMAFVLHPDQGGPGHALRVLLGHAMVLPEVGTAGRDATGDRLSVQRSTFLLRPTLDLGTVAAWLWLAGLLAAAWGLLRGPQPGRHRLMIGAILAGQLLLHAVYGEETFLYALHVVPLLVAALGLAVARWPRPLAHAFLGALVLTTAAHNVERIGRMAASPVDGWDDRFERLDGPPALARSEGAGASGPE